MVNLALILGAGITLLVIYLSGVFKKEISGFGSTIVSGAIVSGETTGRLIGSPLYAAGASLSQLGAASKYLQDVIAQITGKPGANVPPGEGGLRVGGVKCPLGFDPQILPNGKVFCKWRGSETSGTSEAPRSGARTEPIAEFDPFNVGSLVIPTVGPHLGKLGEVVQEARRNGIPQYFIRGIANGYSQDYSPAEVRAGARA